MVDEERREFAGGVSDAVEGDGEEFFVSHAVRKNTVLYIVVPVAPVV